MLNNPKSLNHKNLPFHMDVLDNDLSNFLNFLNPLILII